MNRDLTRIVGKNISIGRKYRELTQKELASQCNCDRSTISRFESGLKSPTVEHLVHIASALDMDIISFFSEDLLKSEAASLSEISKCLDSLAGDYSLMAGRIQIMEESIERSNRNRIEMYERILGFIHHIS